jgi:hypothetical protein
MASTNGVRPSIKALVYGDAGSGKTSFAATWPRPILVLAWDPIGKEMPFYKRGAVQPMTHMEIGTATIPVRQVLDKNGNVVVQVEHYIDKNPRQPEGYSKFMSRWNTLEAEYDQWATIVIDSVTFMELMARKEHQYRLNPTARDPRQWFGGSTDLLEENLMIQVGALPMNCVVTAHVDEDKDEVNGFFVRNPKAPGRLGKGKGLAAAAVEVYRSFVGRDADGNNQYLLQTQTDTIFNCATRIGAPNPCAPMYKALWPNNKVTVQEEA